MKLNSAHLTHEAVLVAVHTRELPDVREGILDTVGQLVRVDVPEAVPRKAQEVDSTLEHRAQGVCPPASHRKSGRGVDQARWQTARASPRPAS